MYLSMCIWLRDLHPNILCRNIVYSDHWLISYDLLHASVAKGADRIATKAHYKRDEPTTMTTKDLNRSSVVTSLATASCSLLLIHSEQVSEWLIASNVGLQTCLPIWDRIYTLIYEIHEWCQREPAIKSEIWQSDYVSKVRHGGERATAKLTTMIRLSLLLIFSCMCNDPGLTSVTKEKRINEKGQE